jgi:hypothetical protein
MEQMEGALSRSHEKMAFLEEGLMREEARGKAIEAGWSKTREQLDALVLTGELDINTIRRDLKGMK